MNPETSKPRKRSLLRRLMLLAGLGLCFVILLIVCVLGMISRDMKRPVKAPETIPLSSLAVKNKQAGAVQTSNTLVARAGTRIEDTASTTVIELVTVDRQLTPESKKKARVINAAFDLFMTKYNYYSSFKYTGSPSSKEQWAAWRREASARYRAMWNAMTGINELLERDFPGSSKQLDRIYLGLCEENGRSGIGDAINFCDARGDWDSAVYYCRRLEHPVDRRISIGTLYLRRFVSVFDGRKSTKSASAH